MVKKETTESCATKNCKCGCCLGKVLVLLLALAGCVAAILACVYSYKNYNLNVLSAGWKENMEKMNDLYKSPEFVKYMTERTNESIESFNAQYWTSTDESDTESLDVDEVLSAEDVAALKENGVVYGPENAKITILEFADANCGYCKRQIAQDKTVDAVMAQLPDDVNMIFKNFPIYNQTAAEAMACAEDQMTPENYHEYVIAVFSAEDSSSVEALSTLAANYGANAETLSACVNNGEKTAEVSATMSEGQSFGISGTPSSVIINNETGKYTLVPGAYPAETFVEAIQALLS